jgi:transposase
MQEPPNEVEGFQAFLRELLAEVAQLKAENARLKEENAELLRRLGMDSSNSHKPPSSDGLAKKRVYLKPGLPKAKVKEKGGQKGHKGETLGQVAEPEQVVLHVAKNCAGCGCDFRAEALASVRIVEKRQVFDLPPATLEVTEHQLGTVKCCGLEQRGTFPDEVVASVQYGARVSALATMLSVDYRLPLERIGQLFSDLYGYELNSSTVLASLRRGYERLAPTEAKVKNQLLAQGVVHFDETGLRSEGKLHWLHTASSQDYTHLFVHEKRGTDALNSSDSVLKDFKGVAVHDCWSSYFTFSSCCHALCGAHLLRELRALVEQGSVWASLMHSYLLELYQSVRPLTNEIKPWLARYQALLEQADQEEPLPTQGKSRPKLSPGRALPGRLTKHQTAVLAFAFEQDVPFTNNQAERDIRPAKVKLKVCGTFRTLTGAKHYARIQGVISTLRKQRMNVFTSLHDLFALKATLLL